MKNRTLTVELAGGLGNQLFGYFAGIYLSSQVNRNLIIDTSSVDLLRASGVYSISSFDIPTVIQHKKKGSFRRLLQRITEALFRYLPNLRVQILESISVLIDRGFSENLAVLSKGRIKKKLRIRLLGYFQDCEYFLRIPAEVRELKLRNPSKWFHSLLTDIESEDVTTLHVRLGDFKQNIESIGILDSSYFKGALTSLQLKSNATVWVFSDDPSEAEMLLKDISGYNLKYIYPPHESDPAETMILISKGKAIVTSNSTFSVVAALMSNQNTRVVIPAKFMRGSEYAIGNLPVSWKKQQSTWLKEIDSSI